MIWDWTTSISISASSRRGEFGVVSQFPTMYLASAQREQLTTPLHRGSNLLVRLHLGRDCANSRLCCSLRADKRSTSHISKSPFLNYFKLVGLIGSETRMPNNIRIFEQGTNVTLISTSIVRKLHWNIIFCPVIIVSN